ncbi:OmpA family protein [Leucothrix pacifica]|uniref:OmpA-like domain-containing protein n=1 Tax=Leucothrix pacifica TaxID=1247513 RepID=A0A317CPQ0_9GAMM|nr:OmpA family protein [Leucothrix pacifica]PWR00539.1 hypothetical protein DKW60_01600 [Leucothrix pacifica]
MKINIKNKLYLAVAALIVSQNVQASPLETIEDNWYIGGAIGQSRLEPEGGVDWDLTDKSDLSKKVYAGVNIGRDFGLEAFWNDLGVAKVTNNKSGAEGEVKYRAYGGNLVYHVPSYLGPIHPIVKLGVAKVDTSGKGVDVDQKNKFDVMGGIGAEYQLEEGFRVRAEYERFDKDIQQLSLGLNWRPVLTRRPVDAPRPVAAPEPQRPIVIVNQQPVAPKPIIKTVVKHVPSPPIVKTVVKHVPSPPIVKTVVKRVPSPPVVKTVVKHVPAPQPVVHKVVVNNPAPAPVAKPAPQPKVIHKTLAGGSNFATNSSTLTNAGRSALNRMASDLIRDKVVIHNIGIIGHTDNVGSHQANQKLSQRRAESVAAYLASRGLNRGLMTVVGRGETQPISSNASAAGRAQNRRVNIVVKGSQTIMR